MMKNQVQLITYPNRFGGRTLKALDQLLQGPLKGVFGGIHLLPFYYKVDGADAGFDPIDHTRVDPQVGTWRDIASLAQDFDLMADVIVNHISSDSQQFRDYWEHGMQSKYHGLFLTRDSVFPDGGSDADLKQIYRPRPGIPFTAVTLADGREINLWTTFSPQQLDIDVTHPEGVAYLDGILDRLHEAGVRAVRLDAVGYAIKRAGHSCFMMPETFAFIDDLTARARARNIAVLVEVHSYYRKQIEIAARVDLVYDFALPPLVLHAFAFHTARYLKSWIEIRPQNAVTVLDTHDGIGIIDAGADPSDRAGSPGLLPDAELDKMVDLIHLRTEGRSRRATGSAAANLDLYQVNCTFFDAMGEDESAYLLARAIQIMLPGIPQIYYVGLLAGHNDMALLEQTGVGRDINRHYYARDEVEAEIKRPVVQKLLELIRLRNSHTAFAGKFRLLDSAGESLALRWESDAEFVELSVDFANSCGSLQFSSNAEDCATQTWHYPPHTEHRHGG